MVDKYGRGLKKGFYEVRIDADKKFLLFVQSGSIKAKIPVISYTSNKKEKEVPVSGKISDKKIAKQMKKEAKQAKKDAYKYRKGENPKDIVFNNIEMKWDKNNECWIIMWEADNSRAIGCFRL